MCGLSSCSTTRAFLRCLVKTFVECFAFDEDIDSFPASTGGH